MVSVMILAARMLFRCASRPRVLVAPSFRIRTGTVASDNYANSAGRIWLVIDKFVSASKVCETSKVLSAGKTLTRNSLLGSDFRIR